MEQKISIPYPVGTYVLLKRQYDWEGDEEYLLHKITNILISCNKQGKWTMKYRAMQVINGKVTSRQRNFDFWGDEYYAIDMEDTNEIQKS